MKIEDINEALAGEPGETIYDVVSTVMESIMAGAKSGSEEEVINMYECLFRCMFENAVLYNCVVGAGLVKNPKAVLKIKLNIEEHIERIALLRMKNRMEEVDETESTSVYDSDKPTDEKIWSMDQMKEFMEGKEN